MPAYKVPCPRCANFIMRDVAVCPFCQAKDPFAPMRCASCNTIIEDPRWVVCQRCGTPVPKPGDAATPGAAATPGSPTAAPSTMAARGAAAPAGTPPAQVPPPPAQAAAPAPAQAPASKFCTGCGAPLVAGARFCTVCGTIAG